MISVAADADPLMQLEVRAMGAPPAAWAPERMDWSRQVAADIPSEGADPTEATAACQPAAFCAQPLRWHHRDALRDGIEVRVDWHLRRADLHPLRGHRRRRQPRACSIRAVRIRTLAPVHVIATVNAQ